MNDVRRLLVLEKRQEVFVFAYKPGQESRVLDVLIEQAKDPRTDFDWFDVAALELKLKEAPDPSEPDPPPAQPKSQKPAMPNRFQQTDDGPLWFMRGLFGPDGRRHGSA